MYKHFRSLRNSNSTPIPPDVTRAHGLRRSETPGAIMATIYKTAVSGDIVGANASVYGGARNLLSRAKRLAGQRTNSEGSREILH